MPDSNAPITLREEDLAITPKDSPKRPPINVNDSVVELIRTAKPSANRQLTDDIVDTICENLSHGVPMEACAACVYATPHTLNVWLEKGRDEVCNLTQEQLDSTENILDLLSPYGKLFLRQAQAKGGLLTHIMDAIYERMHEQHNEWLLTYLAERLDPETFNLKFKMEKMKIESGATNTNVQNFVHIQFVNGIDGRPQEDKDFILDAIDGLRDKYAKKHADGGMRNITPDTSPTDEEDEE